RISAMELDIRPFYSIAKGDHFLSQATQRSYGLHPPQTTSVFEALIIAIVGQKISSVVAGNIRSRIVKVLGTPTTLGSVIIYSFPKPLPFLAAGQEQLRSLGLSTRKAGFILGIASLADTGSLDLEIFKELSNEEAIENLSRLRVIWPWAAQWVLLRALGRRTDAFPAGDLALQRLISELYLKGRIIGEKQAITFAQEKWSSYSGLATTYLFAYLRSRNADAAASKRSMKCIRNHVIRIIS
ncbi:hypothetical protein M1N24_02935, partial [Dehalococcoidia bacterium]|nr:hypothetical protein [Dehalococcoidia bacterium]